MKMRVLVACECSGVVREAFRAKGHDAWSCDLKPSDTPSAFHIQGDVRDVLTQQWDMMIAHPECRYLTNSGALRLYREGKKENGFDPDRIEHACRAGKFFRTLWHSNIPKICIENPIMHWFGKLQIDNAPYTQIIQPWMFGEDASKATCLWLKGLPRLEPTNVIRKKRYANQTPSGQNKLGPSPERSALRARTYQGIADAMAQQWGCPSEFDFSLPWFAGLVALAGQQ